MKKIAVFASGNGSNFQALVNAVKAGRLDAEICLLVCDNPSAPAVLRAEREHIDLFCFTPNVFPDKAMFEKQIVRQLRCRNVDFIVLAGYMRLIGPTLLEEYPGAIVNIHPSLLPAFPGKDAIGQAIDAGARVSGLTIHYVDAGMDTGPIIFQKEIRIHSADSKDDLQIRIQQAEHIYFPEVLQDLFTKGKTTAAH